MCWGTVVVLTILFQVSFRNFSYSRAYSTRKGVIIECPLHGLFHGLRIVISRKWMAVREMVDHDYVMITITNPSKQPFKIDIFLEKSFVPPIESELFFSTGTFLNNYDVRDRKSKPLLIGSTVGKREKWQENNIVETTNTFNLLVNYVLFQLSETTFCCSS